MRNGKVKELVVPEIRNDGTHHWAVVAEHLVNKSVRNFIQETESKVVQFQAKRGDVLVWHGKLMHRGSIPIRPDKLRPAIIAHYSNIRSRRDLGREIARHGRGGYFWQFRFVDNPLTPDLVERTPPHGASTDLGTTGEAKARSKLSHYFGRARTRLKTILPGPRA
jgi:hypothetical protein